MEPAFIDKVLLEALEEARKNAGFSAPNPSVGAVLVKDGEVLSRGFHRGPGQPHAEVEAVRGIADGDLQKSTLFVTLEPCCHHGRTPPCTDLILSKKIPHVVFGYRDPNPVVQGRGQKILHEHGVRCDYHPHDAISAFYDAYLHWWQTGRARLTAKLALSLDGKIAGEGGKPIAITGEEAKVFTHTQRLHADAILTTAQTILQDDPALNVRLKKDATGKKVFVLDRLGKLPWTAKIIRTATSVTLFHGIEADEVRLEALKGSGVSLVRTPSTPEGLDLGFVLDYLGKEEGLHDVWLEAGGKSFMSFYRGKLLDRAFLIVGSCWLGDEALPAFDRPPEGFFSSAIQSRWSALGRDSLLELRWKTKCSPE